MDDLPRGYEVVSTSKHRRECRELRLVLAAMGIGAHTIHDADSWILLVRSEDYSAAIAELEAYHRENADRSLHEPKGTRLYGGAAIGAAGYAATIIIVAIMSDRRAYGLDWLGVGRVHAEKVIAGEWWRPVTALTLHVDAAHLFSNVMFGVLFGFLAGRVLGGGVAWLAILIAGALGNTLNSLVQAPDHLSIGASTAVFSALGIIVAHALRPPLHPNTAKLANPLVRWSPLVGGVSLLAMTGVGGERTDVLAHITGFLAGLLVGWFGCRLSEERLADSITQQWAGYFAIGIVMVSWIYGFLFAKLG
jgi:rhomboid protease GluP